MDVLDADVILYICGFLRGIAALPLLSCCKRYRTLLPLTNRDIAVTVTHENYDLAARLCRDWGAAALAQLTFTGKELTLRQYKHFHHEPSRLRALCIRHSGLSGTQFYSALRPFAETLCLLDIQYCAGFSADSAWIFGRCKRLTTLRFSGSLTSDTGMQRVMACPALVELTLHDCPLLLDDDLWGLTRCKTLRVIRMHRMYLTSACGVVLAECPSLRQLWFANCCRLDDRLVEYLAASKSLRWVHFQDCHNVTEMSFHALVALPGIAVVTWCGYGQADDELQVLRHTKTVVENDCC